MRSVGAVLPIVLLIVSMMLTTSAAWFEAVLMQTRGVINLRDVLQAFHSADSALTLCARAVLASNAPVIPAVATEPAGWKLKSVFEGGAFSPIPQWSDSGRAPQCLVEAWQLNARAGAQAFLLTARGFGVTEDAQVWLQLELVVDGPNIERRWRRVAARPF